MSGSYSLAEHLVEWAEVFAQDHVNDYLSCDQEFKRAIIEPTLKAWGVELAFTAACVRKNPLQGTFLRWFCGHRLSRIERSAWQAGRNARIRLMRQSHPSFGNRAFDSNTAFVMGALVDLVRKQYPGKVEVERQLSSVAMKLLECWEEAARDAMISCYDG